MNTEMTRKIIAVVPLWDDAKQSIWMLPGYLDGIRAAGGIPSILPLTKSEEEAYALLKMCSGLLMTGGQDINPRLYGQSASSRCGEICPERDAMEPHLFNEALKHDKPVLGICRGLQMINVVLGGTLYQDLPSQTNSNINHRMKPPYDRECHRVNLVQGTALHRLLQVEIMGVTSNHHQGIDKLGEGLEVMAASEDGIIEAVSLPEKKFVWAVQWHPEYDYLKNVFSKKIFQAFVEACGQTDDSG